MVDVSQETQYMTRTFKLLNDSLEETPLCGGHIGRRYLSRPARLSTPNRSYYERNIAGELGLLSIICQESLIALVTCHSILVAESFVKGWAEGFMKSQAGLGDIAKSLEFEMAYMN